MKNLKKITVEGERTWYRENKDGSWIFTITFELSSWIRVNNKPTLNQSE